MCICFVSFAGFGLEEAGLGFGTAGLDYQTVYYY